MTSWISSSRRTPRSRASSYSTSCSSAGGGSSRGYAGRRRQPPRRARHRGLASPGLSASRTSSPPARHHHLLYGVALVFALPRLGTRAVGPRLSCSASPLLRRAQAASDTAVARRIVRDMLLTNQVPIVTERQARLGRAVALTAPRGAKRRAGLAERARARQVVTRSAGPASARCRRRRRAAGAKPSGRGQWVAPPRRRQQRRRSSRSGARPFRSGVVAPQPRGQSAVRTWSPARHSGISTGLQAHREHLGRRGVALGASWTAYRRGGARSAHAASPLSRGRVAARARPGLMDTPMGAPAHRRQAPPAPGGPPPNAGAGCGIASRHSSSRTSPRQPPRRTVPSTMGDEDLARAAAAALRP